MWNNIPYYDEHIYDQGNPNSVKSTNLENAWPKIEADFQAAMAVLPETQTQPGRATRYAAMAMLAKCNMYQAFDRLTGTPRMDQLTAAKTLLDQIMASGKYHLVEQYHHNFSDDLVNRNNGESIFEVQYSVTASVQEGGGWGDFPVWPSNGPGGCCGFYQPSQNLVNACRTDVNGLPLLEAFNETEVTNDEGVRSDEPFTPFTGRLDPRLDWVVGRRSIPFLDWGRHPGKKWIRDPDQSYGPYSPKKPIGEKKFVVVPEFPQAGSNNFRMLRYAHILLWAAECEVEVGSLAKAQQYVNQIRRRAANPDGFVKVAADPNKMTDWEAYLRKGGQPAANYLIKEYAEPWTNQDSARQAVRFEERLEFAMEGTRFFDLVRWGIAAEELKKYLEKEKLKRAYLNGAVFTKGTNEYFPIPQQEIDKTYVNGKQTLQQNPGY